MGNHGLGCGRLSSQHCRSRRGAAVIEATRSPVVDMDGKTWPGIDPFCGAGAQCVERAGRVRRSRRGERCAPVRRGGAPTSQPRPRRRPGPLGRSSPRVVRRGRHRPVVRRCRPGEAGEPRDVVGVPKSTGSPVSSVDRYQDMAGPGKLRRRERMTRSKWIIGFCGLRLVPVTRHRRHRAGGPARGRCSRAQHKIFGKSVAPP